MDVRESLSPLSCNGTQPCQDAFADARLALRYLNPENASLVANFVHSVFGETLPIERSTNAVNQIYDNPPFHCPEIDVDIYQPCQVTSCVYWTNNEWTRNCILYYCVDYQREGLDVKELAFLLDETSLQIRSQTIQAMTKLRHVALKQKTRQEAGPPLPRIDKGGDVCAVCKAEFTKQYKTQSGFTYCSLNCYTTKPPLELQLEKEFGLPVKRVLEICVSSFVGRRPVCHALGVTTKQLQKLCAHHCIDISYLT